MRKRIILILVARLSKNDFFETFEMPCDMHGDARAVISLEMRVGDTCELNPFVTQRTHSTYCIKSRVNARARDIDTCLFARHRLQFPEIDELKSLNSQRPDSKSITPIGCFSQRKRLSHPRLWTKVCLALREIIFHCLLFAREVFAIYVAVKFLVDTFVSPLIHDCFSSTNKNIAVKIILATNLEEFSARFSLFVYICTHYKRAWCSKDRFFFVVLALRYYGIVYYRMCNIAAFISFLPLPFHSRYEFLTGSLSRFQRVNLFSLSTGLHSIQTILLVCSKFYRLQYRAIFCNRSYTSPIFVSLFKRI